MELVIKNAKEGEVVLVSEEDYEGLVGYRWTIIRQKRDGYTKKYVWRREYDKHDPTKYKAFYLHREIMGHPDGMEIDHISGNGLDNRRENLRVVSRKQNQRNRTNGRSAFGKTNYGA